MAKELTMTIETLNFEEKNLVLRGGMGVGGKHFQGLLAAIEKISEVQFMRGISNLWTSVNHVALVVSDVGRSLAFYTDVLGMKQVIRPNFDRYKKKKTADDQFQDNLYFAPLKVRTCTNYSNNKL
jgi:hypothetical protein